MERIAGKHQKWSEMYQRQARQNSFDDRKDKLQGKTGLKHMSKVMQTTPNQLMEDLSMMTK